MFSFIFSVLLYHQSAAASTSANNSLDYVCTLIKDVPWPPLGPHLSVPVLGLQTELTEQVKLWTPEAQPEKKRRAGWSVFHC